MIETPIVATNAPRIGPKAFCSGRARDIAALALAALLAAAGSLAVSLFASLLKSAAHETSKTLLSSADQTALKIFRNDV
jgi:hypothetical protein